MKKALLGMALCALCFAAFAGSAAADNGQQNCSTPIAVFCDTLTLQSTLTGPPSPKAPASSVYYQLSGNLYESAEQEGVYPGVTQLTINEYVSATCIGPVNEAIPASTNLQGAYSTTLGYQPQDNPQTYSYRTVFSGSGPYPANTSQCVRVVIPGTAPQGGNGNGNGQPTPPAVDVCNNVPGNQATIPDGWLPDGQGGCFEPNWVMVCTTSAHLRGDGTLGTFFQILDTQWASGKDDPSSIYYKSTPAIFVKGYGTMCQISDVFTYGGDPAKFKDAGYPVDETGIPTPQGVSPADWGSIYEYWIPTS